jgi:hypothetical protein
VKEWKSARDVSWRSEEAEIAERTLKHSSHGGRPSLTRVVDAVVLQNHKSQVP